MYYFIRFGSLAILVMSWVMLSVGDYNAKYLLEVSANKFNGGGDILYFDYLSSNMDELFFIIAPDSIGEIIFFMIFISPSYCQIMHYKEKEFGLFVFLLSLL